MSFHALTAHRSIDRIIDTEHFISRYVIGAGLARRAPAAVLRDIRSVPSGPLLVPERDVQRCCCRFGINAQRIGRLQSRPGRQRRTTPGRTDSPKPCARRCARCLPRVLACGSGPSSAGISAGCLVANIPLHWPAGTRGWPVPSRSERVAASESGRGAVRPGYV